MTDGVELAVIRTLVDGTTEFGRAVLDVAIGSMVDGVPPFGATDPMPADYLAFFVLPVGLAADWHPAPRRQLYVQIVGEVMIGVGTGERRTFGPGDAVLAEDVGGVGHTIEVTSTETAVAAIVALRA